MTEVPKIVVERLRAASQSLPVNLREHPEANILAAFAEQTLSVNERIDVLGHLARCGDCRENVALAMPVEDAAVAPIAEVEQPAAVLRPMAITSTKWFSWPRLSLAALAAGVAVAAGVLLLPHAPVDPATIATKEHIQIPGAATGAATKEKEISRSVPGKRGTFSSLSTVADSEPNQAEDAVKAATTSSLQAHAATHRPVASATSRLNRTTAAQAATGIGESENAAAAESASPGAVPNFERATDFSGDASAEEAASQDHAAPAVEKAKQPLPVTSQAEASGNIAGSFVFALSSGVLQRSINDENSGSGRSWKTVLRADRALTCYSNRGADAWAAGESGTLFHSTDGGVTWSQLQVATLAETLTADIARIEVSDDDAGAIHSILVTSSDSRVWRSSDGGKTWETTTANSR